MRNKKRFVLALAAALWLAVPVYAEEECVHSFVQYESAATCTEPGAVWEECRKCGLQTNFENTPALGHDFGEWSVESEPSCDTEGREVRECGRCGYREERAITAPGHDYFSEQIDPTCEKQGYTKYTCANCGDSYGEDYIPALGHSYTSQVVDPTCEKEGCTEYTCTVCGDSYQEDIVPALGHSYTSQVVEPTCKKEGYTEYTCSVCGDRYKGDYTPELGHAYTDEVVEPTCTARGYTNHVCERCFDSYKDTYTDAAGHDYDEGVQTQDPTTTAMGRITYTCRRCGDTYQETIPKLTNPFKDVHSNDYFYYPVLWAVSEGITSGTDESHFSPNAVCTRAQVVTFLWRAAGKPEPAGQDCPFVDVPPSGYYFKAVLWAAENGITSGTDATHFSPNAPCTRGQVVTFLHRAKGCPEPEGRNYFLDVKEDDYFAVAVVWAWENEITYGVDDWNFGPNQTCTRAQIVTFLYRAKDIGSQLEESYE